MSEFKDKVIVITGAASGIGLETAKLFASQGAKLSLADVQEDALEEAAAEIQKTGATVITAVVDVRKRAQVESWIQTTVAKFGKLDGAANIAGVIGKQNNMALITEIDDEDWAYVVGVNQTGLMNCLRAEIPHIKDGVGSIVNAASVAGVLGFARNAAYVASKHAVVGLTRCAAKELGERGIRCNCFCPGPIDTPMFRKAADIRGTELNLDHISLRRKAHPSEVANLVEWLLSEKSSYVTGTTQQIDGGWVV